MGVPAEGEDVSAVVSDVQVIPPRSGASLRLAKGRVLTVIDPEGEQVSDLVAFNARDIEEYISSGRSIDYAGRIFLTKGRAGTGAARREAGPHTDRVQRVHECRRQFEDRRDQGAAAAEQAG
jgi:uncharacterized protein YcgI (DUF1989 family)